VLGFEPIEVGPEVARARTEVGQHHKQPYGIVHGGVYAALAETITSHATAEAVFGDGNIAMGMSNNTTFLRPISSGTINAEARSRHRGRTSWVWDVEMSDDDGRLCALSRVTIAVRPKPAGGS
jgi:1,4-dihydroxy-2-naphthoyl-CoA hydrolase